MLAGCGCFCVFIMPVQCVLAEARHYLLWQLYRHFLLVAVEIPVGAGAVMQDWEGGKGGL